MLWCHGGLSCGVDGVLLDSAARRCGAEVVAIDRPGIGGSEDWPLAGIAEWPAVVEGVLAELGWDTFAVAGWSGGGPYALACAAAMPERVRAAATVAGLAPLASRRDVAGLGLATDRLLIAAAHRVPRAAATALGLARHLPDRYFARQVRELAAGRRDAAALRASPREAAALVGAYPEATRHGTAGMVQEYRRYLGPWGFDPGALRQPVTVWQGQDDTAVPMSHARRLAGALPNSVLRVVASTGHLLPLVAAGEILGGPRDVVTRDALLRRSWPWSGPPAPAWPRPRRRARATRPRARSAR